MIPKNYEPDPSKPTIMIVTDSAEAHSGLGRVTIVMAKIPMAAV